MSQTKLHMCFEGENSKGDPLYLIYSMTESAFKASGAPPSFNLEKVIAGNKDMGCGAFGSKIVFAGGLIKGQETTGKVSKVVISYDMNSEEVSSTDIPDMREGKFQPYVFELNNKLYVLNTTSDVRSRSFETYYPKQNYWHQIRHPYYSFSPNFIDTLVAGPSCYSCFVFGKCVCISWPHDSLTYLHHSKHVPKAFKAKFFGPLPFYGMATTYCQSGYDDVVLISFHEGRVEGRRLDSSRPRLSGPRLEAPVLIFKAESSSHPSHYFADFGNGNFCLATSDKSSIHVYMFKISRCQNGPDGSLKLRLLRKHMHKYDLTHFCREDKTSSRLVGCFSPLSRGCKEEIEAKLYAPCFPLLSFEKGDDDYELNEESREELKRLSEPEESDESDYLPDDNEGSTDIS